MVSQREPDVDSAAISSAYRPTIGSVGEFGTAAGADNPIVFAASIPRKIGLKVGVGVGVGVGDGEG
jgi:hypothetical protein